MAEFTRELFLSGPWTASAEVDRAWYEGLAGKLIPGWKLNSCEVFVDKIDKDPSMGTLRFLLSVNADTEEEAAGTAAELWDYLLLS